MQRTDIEPDDIEPDGYFPVAKHARRTPTNPHLAAVPANGSSNGRAVSRQPATADAWGPESTCGRRGRLPRIPGLRCCWP